MPRSPELQASLLLGSGGAGAGAPRKAASDAERLKSVGMKRRLSFIYCFSMVCVGLCFGAQGPATLALAEQSGVVSNALTGEDTPAHPRDVSRLGQMGIANGADAMAGIFGALLWGSLVHTLTTGGSRWSWHWVLCIYMIWQ